MKKFLLPYYGKYVGLLLVAGAGWFAYQQNGVVAAVALVAGLLVWLFSAERMEDERTAYRRLVACRAAALALLLFVGLFTILVLSGRSASPSVFCVAPVALVVYLVAFYGGLLMPFERNRAE